MPDLEPDFKEMLSELLDAKVEFLLVGGHALGFHGETRNTRDIDFWINPTDDNAHKVREAMRSFGAPMAMFTLDDLAKPGMVFQLGVPPVRIDLITAVAGVNFADAWPNRIERDYDGLTVPIIGMDDLITNKRAAGRPQDLLDADKLERIRDAQRP